MTIALPVVMLAASIVAVLGWSLRNARYRELRWRRIVEAAPDLLWTATADGSVDYFSHHGAALIGAAPSALLGWGWLDALHPDDRATSEQAWTDAVAEQREYRAEHRLRSADGAYRWFSSLGQPVRNDAGQVVGWVGACHDVTEHTSVRTQLERLREQVRMMKQLARSSLWEFALRDGVVANAYLAVDDNLWATGFGRAQAADFRGVLLDSRITPECQERILTAIQACVDGTTSEFQVEFALEDDDGLPHWRQMRGNVQRGPDGTPSSFRGAAVDITDLKRSETELRRLKERLDLALRGSQVSVWDFLLQGDDVRRSRLQAETNVWTLRGHDGEIPTIDLASSLALIMPPEDQERMFAAIEACVRGETPDFQVEYRATGYTDGRVQWRFGRGTVLRDENGVPYRFLGTSVDVTRLKQVEEEKRIATEHLRLATGLSGIYAWVFDLCGGSLADARATFINMRESLGHDAPGEALDLASSVALLIVPEDQELVTRRAEACIAGHTAQFEAEYRVRRGDGSIRWNLGRGIVTRDAAGAPVRLIGTSVDITELKRVAEESRRHEERLQLAVLGSRACTWDYEMPDGSLANARAAYTNVWESLGYESADSDRFAAGLAALIHPDDQQTFATTVESFLRSGERDWEIECRVRHKDGSDRWHLGRGVVARDATDGRPIRFTGSSIDITDRRLAESALRDSEERFRLTFENAAVGMVICDASGTFLQCNGPFGDFFGHLPEEMVGLRFEAFAARDGHEDVAASGAAPGSTGDRRFLRKDGASVWATITVSVVQRDAAGEPDRTLAILQDISERKALEQELQRTTERLELGVRGSSVAIFDFEMPDGRIEASKQTMINVWETLGYAPATAPRDFLSGAALAVHPQDLELVHDAIGGYLAGATARFEVEYRTLHKDGEVQWRIARGTAIRDADGKPIRFAGSFIDVTDQKRVEVRLQESERRWRSLADSLPQLVWTATADGKFDYFSAQTTAYTGLSERALLDGAWHESTHPEDRESASASWAEAVARQRDHEVEHRIRRWDGVYRWFSRRALPVRDVDGRVVKWFGTCTDITRGKELEEELRHAKERLELAIRGSNVTIWEHDMPDGVFETSRLTLTNVWESLGYGGPVDDAAGVELLMHPEDLGPVSRQMQAYLAGEGGAFETEHRVLHKDGTYRWVLARGMAVRDAASRLVRFVGTSVDITALKRIEGELKRAREAAESANRAKDDFLANVSHEIRTPMNAILGMTELALDAARTDHQRQLLATVKSAARNLLGIIDDLLDFSKIAAGKLALDEADFVLRDELGHTLRAVAARAHEKGLELVCDVRPDVPDALFGDAGRLRQVLMNLLGNAIKFTARGEVAIKVTLSRAAPDDGTLSVAFAIRDTGIGIAPDKQAAVFRAFEQEDSSTTRRYGGTGLGLTISAQLVALMGGELTVESAPGQGSTFGFTARFARSSRQELSTSPSPPDLPGGLRVLVVDDNETHRRLLEEWLVEWRIRHTAVADAAAALETLARAEESQAPYALVLLDGRMPDVDGLTLAGRIQERYGTASAKRLILLSPDDDPLLAARSGEAGIGAYLLKPIQQSELLETIRRMMSSTSEVAAGVPATGGRELGASTPALRILVAEDNDLNIALLEELLGQRGHRARFAGDGRAGLALATEEPFDLFLLDLHMPEMDGFAVLSAIRERERLTNQHLPIIALTARSSKRDRERCFAEGVDDFVSKPIEAAALWAAIDRVVALFPPQARDARLLDPRVILRTCGGRSAVLARLCEVFRRTLPDQMARVRSALRDGDLPRLRGAAHMLYATLAAFSTIAGAVALALEESAQRGETESCADLVEQLESMCSELLQDTRTLTLTGLGHREMRT